MGDDRNDKMNDKKEGNRFVAVGENSGFKMICERYDAGDIPVCPVCGEDLLVLLSWEEARKAGGSPGVYCNADSKHCCIHFNVSG